MRRLLGLVAALAVVSTAAVHAAELPKEFLGGWKNNDGSNEFEVTGISIGARTYHEPGYNCDIKSVGVKKDPTTGAQVRLYVVEMACAGESEKPERPKRVHEVWALRKVKGQDVLVIAGTSGPTYPSIHVLERAE
jgi:hypothetical protein